MNPSFDTHDVPDGLIARVVDRAAKRKLMMDDRLALTMDLSASHANGTPIDFQKMLDAPAVDFAHDILGIQRHLNRQTGKLENCFVPRCAKRSL